MLYVYDPIQDDEGEEDGGGMERKFSILDDVEFEKHFVINNASVDPNRLSSGWIGNQND